MNRDKDGVRALFEGSDDEFGAESFLPLGTVWRSRDRLCIFIIFCHFNVIRKLMYLKDRKMITTRQRGHTAHSLRGTKSSVGADQSADSSSVSEDATSSAANRCSRIAPNSSSVRCQTSNRRSQSFAQCPIFPHQRQVSGVCRALRAASISIRTGLLGVRVA